MGSLAGRTALVTGAARGLGEAIAHALAAEGAGVALLDVLTQEGLGVAGAIRAAGGTCHFATCDIRNTAAVEAAVAAAQAALGPVDILINNAAIAPAPAPIDALPEAVWHDVFDVNVASIYRFCRVLMPQMRAAGGGVVINLASVHQSHSLDGWTAYAATKGAVISMTRQLAVEWGRFNIRVLSVSPGAIDATMTRGILDRDPTGQLEAEFCGMHALERLGRPEEVGRTVAFLASDGAGFITGEDILVDGGLTRLCRLPRREVKESR